MPLLGYLDSRAPEEPVAQLVSKTITIRSASLPCVLNSVFKVIAIFANVSFQLPSGPDGPDREVGLKNSEEAEYQRHSFWTFQI